MFRPITFILLPSLLFLCAGVLLHAQYSDSAFTQKKAGELYDERGFYQNKAITVDGQLIVSNSNGNVSYSYPISNWQADGYVFSTSLNYCGSAAFSTHGEYSPGSIDDPYVHWAQFSQNRPIWLLGVNGFAVQSLSLATAFHADPEWIDDRYTNSSVTTFDDEDFLWTLDGYDACNRMQDFATGDYDEPGGGGGGSRYVYRDVIKLLRADGSLLELLNVNEAEDQKGTSDNWGLTQGLYSGYYVVNEANSPGYAWVELVSDNTQLYPFHIDRELPDAPRYTPRKVHYYPGDGLEYIFLERFAPYGMQDITQALLRFGGAKAGPTIFYLSEIRSAGRTLVGFTYSRHGVQYRNTGDLLWDMRQDSTMGRALLLNYDNHTISYGDSWMTISAFGRTTTVRFDSVLYSGNAEPSQIFPLATLGYGNGWSDALANMPINNGAQYKSWAGYVTKIIDPEGRETSFDYEQYERRQVNYGWPRPSGAQTITVKLKNYRLNEIIEPTAKYEIKYHNRLGLYDVVDTDGLDTLTVHYGFENHHPFAFSNGAREVKKRTLSGTLLTTDRYDFILDALPDAPPTTPDNCTVVSKDEVTGFVDSTIYSYSRQVLPRSIPYSPKKYYTKLNDIDYSAVDPTGTVIQTTHTSSSYAAAAPYLWLPTAQSVTIDGMLKSSTSFDYDVETVRTFGGDSTLMAYHGSELLRQVRHVHDPHTFDLHLADTIVYLNVPELDTTITHTDSVPNWSLMRRRYDSLRYQVQDSLAMTVDFSRMTDDPRVRARRADLIVDGVYKIPPIFGLVSQSWSSDGSGHYLGGKRSYYCQFEDCDAGPATSSWFNKLLLVGAKIADTVIGRGREREVAGEKVFYEEANRGLPDYVENTFGSRTHYNYGHLTSQPIPIGTGDILDNANVVSERTLLSTSYLSQAFGVPQIQKEEVRTYTPAGTLVTDTLTTMQELTYFGQTATLVDPNGWLSEFDYDYNGRLNTAWLPGDFQSSDSIYYFDVTGLEVHSGGGSSRWQVEDVEEHWNSACNTMLSQTVTNSLTEHYGGFIVNKPYQIKPLCGGGYDTLASYLDEKGAEIQTTTHDLYYKLTSPAIATLSFNIQQPGVEEILRLDSGFVVVSISSIIGECVTLRVTLPAYETFEQTYVLNCLELDLNNDDTLSSLYPIRIPLGTYLDSIADDQTVSFQLETTTSGAEVRFINSTEATDDSKPGLHLYGEFRKYNRLADYTLNYGYNDTLLKSEIWAKVDDSLHTSNRGIGGAAMLGESRRSKVEYSFGADYRILKGRTFIGNPNSPSRVDSIQSTHTGLGAVLKATDQIGDTVSTVYDALGRPIKNYNQDGTFSTIAYYTCGYDLTPDPECDPCPDSSCFGIDPGDQDFYGFILAKVTTDENGVKSAQYFDAFDRLRREIADSGGLHRVTKYEYDPLGRTKMVVNPAHDTIVYWYDDLGRLQYKQQPDLGTISYAYDDLGNPRFLQTQEQHEEHRITFNEYDDLNRLTIVGEADFSDEEEGPPGGGGEGGGGSSIYDGAKMRPDESAIAGLSFPAGLTLSANPQSVTRNPQSGDPEKSGLAVLNVPTDDTLNLGRLTDQLDPNYLHDSGKSIILTANKTLWTNPAAYGKTVPTFWGLNLMDTVARNCSTMNSLRPDAIGPFLRHPAAVYNPTATISTMQDFENLAKYPENVRIAISYDRLPENTGPVWGTFPADSVWNALAPTGMVRNLKGEEAVVAYREHGGEPYHYSVISYDERGRVEALIHYTENLGFDAIYYKYNSLDEVITLTVVDPLRRYTTWYGYDHNGRVDSVWTKLENVGSGLWNPGTGVWAYNASAVSHSNQPEIRYLYTKTGQVDTMWYPRINTKTAYKYNQRKWLDTLIATRGANDIFRQYLTFDPTGQIIKQMSKQGTALFLQQNYEYDDLGQLTRWYRDSGTSLQVGELYTYDSVGNRTVLYNENNTGTITSWRAYDIGRRTSTTDGPNQMLKKTNRGFLFISDYTTYAYDPDGAQTRRKLYNGSGTLQLDEKFSYSSWRGLSWKYERTNPALMSGSDTWEWRYRYNAMGEREQKRQTLAPGGDGTVSNGYDWKYYLLGESKEQLSLWEGLQTSDPTFCGLPGGGGSYVHLSPSEYLVFGVEYPGIREDVPRLRLFANNQQEYRITDHLASVRTTLNQSGTVTGTYNYEPFGDLIAGTEARQGFNSREKDQEVSLFNNGVRKLDDEEGKFTSIDPLWEKFPAWSPYQYGYNNPLTVTDPDGMQARLKQYKDIPGEGPGGAGGIPRGGVVLPVPKKAPAKSKSSAKTSGNTQSATKASTIQQNRATGKSAEQVHSKQYGGSQQVYRKTSKGGRFIDNLTKSGTAQEVKTGKQGLTQSNKVQIQKDIELRNSETSGVKRLEWHFYPNQKGAVGPTKALRDYLLSNDITIVIHTLLETAGSMGGIAK